MGFSGRAGWFVLSGSEVWFCEWLVGFWGVLFGVFCLFVFVKKCVRVFEGERTAETARIPCCSGCLGWCMLRLVWCVLMLSVYSGLGRNLGAWISS